MHHSISMSKPGGSRRASAAVASLVGLMIALASPAYVTAQDTDAEGGAIAFPETLVGETLEPQTFSGPEWLDQFRDGDATDTTFIEGTEGLLEELGKDIEDLTVTTAMVEPTAGNASVVTALTVDGVESRAFAQDAAQLMLGDVVSPQLTLQSLAGKWVVRVVDETMPGVYPRTIYLKDDTAWIIQADKDNVKEALRQLPEPDAVGGIDSMPMIGQVPLTLDDRRRLVLYEATEPFFLPTISERLSPDLEAWLLDAYLEAGLSPAEMLGVWAFWGIDPTDSIQIEGYQLVGVGEDLAERFRTEIILAGGTELPEGIGRAEAEVGGRDVTTLDFGVSKQHVFRTDDTVWVVTDHVGEVDMAEEAVAALP